MVAKCFTDILCDKLFSFKMHMVWAVGKDQSHVFNLNVSSYFQRHVQMRFPEGQRAWQTLSCAKCHFLPLSQDYLDDKLSRHQIHGLALTLEKAWCLFISLRSRKKGILFKSLMVFNINHWKKMHLWMTASDWSNVLLKRNIFNCWHVFSPIW